MKNSGRIIAAILCAILMLSIFTACKSDPAGTSGGDVGQPEAKKYVIGVAEAQANDDVTARREFYENYIGPAYNVEFIFSEQCADDTATKAFIENCIDMGADAIIDFKSCNTTMAQLCEQNGLAYVINSVPRASNFDLYEGSSSAFAGGVAGNNKMTGSYVADWVKENSSEDGSEGFLIASCVASSGVVEHIQITTQVLEALQAKYGLTYTQEIADMVASPDPVIVENDKGLNIYVYPGSPNKDTWLTGVSPLLQSGDYGVFVSCGETYDKSANVIDEVEHAKNIDIKVVSLGALSSAPVAFSTTDAFGNTSVDMIVVSCSTIQSATLFAVTYNARTNGTACMYVDGLPTSRTCNKLPVTNYEDAMTLDGYDNIETEKWIANTDFIDQLLMCKTEGLTVEGMKDLLSGIDFEAIKDIIG